MDSIDVKFTLKEKVKGKISAKGVVNGQIYARGPKGDTGIGIETIIQNEDYTLTILMSDGTSITTSSIRGLTGNGIASIKKTSTEGLIDTYTITYTDGNTDNFTVTNANTGSAYTKTEINELLKVLEEADNENSQNINNLNSNLTSNINQVNTKINNLTHDFEADKERIEQLTFTEDWKTLREGVFFRKVGTDVEIRFNIENLNQSIEAYSHFSLGQIPEEYRPNEQVRIPVISINQLIIRNLYVAINHNTWGGYVNLCSPYSDKLNIKEVYGFVKYSIL